MCVCFHEIRRDGACGGNHCAVSNHVEPILWSGEAPVDFSIKGEVGRNCCFTARYSFKSLESHDYA